MRGLSLLSATALALLAGTTGAQNYPSKPVRLIVPYAAGGSSDIIARLYGQRLSEDMPHTINPAVYGKVPYDPVKDFTPLTLVARAPQWLFLNPSVPAKTARELIALAKAQPGKLKIGSAGNGSGTHLMAELFTRGAGVDITHVPYKGAGPAVTATVGGEMNMVFTSMPAAVAFVQSGRLRPVGVTTAQRHPSHPEVPTFQESGVPNMVLTHWFGVLAPAGIARPIRDRLVREFTAAASYPAIVERYRALVLEPVTTTPEEFLKLIETDLARWGKVVREAGIKAQ